jgi:hypothetical protein
VPCGGVFAISRMAFYFSEGVCLRKDRLNILYKWKWLDKGEDRAGNSVTRDRKDGYICGYTVHHR